MLVKLDESKIVEKITQLFVNQDKYLFDKHVHEYKVKGKFLGDFFSQLAVEPRGEKAPIFFYTYSPFDVISNKAPHRAAVFVEGNMLLETDFDPYTALRTAAMSVVVMRALTISSTSNKKILLFGAGNIATKSLRFLKAFYPELTEVSCISKSGNLEKITIEAMKLGINLVAGKMTDISDYDVIICHTQAEVPVLTEEQRSSIKKGALITSFISSTEHGELADSYFDSSRANIICDWEMTLKGAKEVARSITAGKLHENSVIMLKDFLNGDKMIDPIKDYTIYRSTGTPIQNMAILQLLLELKNA